ncbi:hypothetical protein [Streptomyces glomeratus]|uniref:Integral membrane protein n=1 Tax=Streptomyces glomeratus TaxID=284452 RepID=A0ABP6M1F8_9ACTN|nr:hypothetical protein [Streptomyces glomeratus]MCF1508991.1 hypothetical protein [Streptomyces glomeratus]
MDLQKPPSPRPVEGCLAVAIRLPVRIVVLVLVVPVRMTWDALVAGGRVLRDAVLRLVGRALLWAAWAVFVRPWTMLWRYGLVPLGTGLAWLGRTLVAVPAGWAYRTVLTPLGRAAARVLRGIGAGLGHVYGRVLTPVGHALALMLRGIGYVLAALGGGACAVAAWLVRYPVAVPARRLHRHVLRPLGHVTARLARGIAGLVGTVAGVCGAGLLWLLNMLLVVPASAVWRWILAPAGRVLMVVGRELGAAFRHAWRVAGHISLAVGRFLGILFRWMFLEPVRWAYRTVLTPVGHAVRDTVLRPAAEAARGVGRVVRQTSALVRETARQARADLRRVHFGDSGRPTESPRREPIGRAARTLGSRTTALTKD